MAINVEAFYDAINNISKQQVDSTPKDLTINAEIVNLYNVDTGEYKVEYQSNTFSAFSSDPTITYSLGEHVFVLVPKGDFSQRKIILGRAVGEISDSQAQDLTNFFIDQGPNWVSGEEGTYSMDHTPLQICAISKFSKESLKRDPSKEDCPNYEDQGFRRWACEDEGEARDGFTRYPTTYPTPEDLEVIDQHFVNYANSFDWLKIAATFRTEFLQNHSNGEYYLSVTFIANNPRWVPEDDPLYDLRKDEEPYEFIEYRLDFKSFNGSPYQYAVDTPQKTYIQIDTGVLKGLYKVSLMQDGQLVCDVKPSYDADGNLTYKVPEDNVVDRNNIFADNIEIRFCKRVNLLDTPYFVWIEMPEGDSVYEAEGGKTGRPYVTLVPHMYHYTQEVTSDCRIMWFREDLSIPEENNPSQEDRDEDGRVWTFYTGPGWRPIEQFVEEGIDDYIINENDHSLVVQKEAVVWQWRYKLVCIYEPAEGHPFGEDIATVKRSDSKYDLFIENLTSVDSNGEMIRISDYNALVGVDIDPTTGTFYPEWFGTWYQCLDDNSYTMIDPPYLNGPLALNPFLLYEHVLFRVACYDPKQVNPPNGVYDQETMKQVKEIGYLTYELNSATDGGLLISWEGTKSFNYTALGQCYDHVSDKEYTLAPKLSWVHDASAYDLQIYSPDNKPLGSRSFYNPEATDGDSSTMTGNGYSPKTSMLQEMYQDSNNVLHFKVRQEYDADRVGGTKNTVYCRVHTIKDDMWYESYCEISFTKDGQQGTQGTGWTAPLALTNNKDIMRNSVNSEGQRVDLAMPAFSDRLGLSVFPMILTPREGVEGVYDQDREQSKILLRPFVTKDGKRLDSDELGDEANHYRYKIYWDVRFPKNSVNEQAANASFFRICGATDGSPITTTGDYNKGDVNPEGANGLTAMTSWAHDPNDPNHNATYGAVEIRYEPGAGLLDENGLPTITHEDLNFYFVVRAQIDIETNLATNAIVRKMGQSMGEFEKAYEKVEHEKQEFSGTWHRIKSINSWFSVDVFIEGNTAEDRVKFNPLRTTCNWPTDLQYDSRGYNPIVDADYLEFYYGFFPDSQDKTEGKFITPENKTPAVQGVDMIPLTTSFDDEDETKALADQQYGTVLSKVPEYNYKLKPKGHLNWQEGTVGALEGLFNGDTAKEIPAGKFYRNQVYHCNTYDNVDINSWDGQGIDINEDNGTIFAPTIGAGFKGPLTNTFTGVLMGVNTAYLRDTDGITQYEDMGVAGEELEVYPYMTGLFGYQCGYASFGILENGTAFFGRKDRGGRIIIDGYNATIYGGGNGELNSPQIGDPMWNNMRLTLVDLSHATSGYSTEKQADDISTLGDDPSTQGNVDGKNTLPTTTAVQDIVQGFYGEYFGDGKQRDTYGVSSELPGWYEEIWTNAYIKGQRTRPWWMDWHKNTDPNLPEFDGRRYDEYMENMSINYWNPDLDKVRTYAGISDNQNTKNITGFGPARASTTPAIEIGQHPTGLMPGLLAWGASDTVFEDLYIPGDRNFMVTYDGTLWAMNGVFMGNVIGSNIIGGRLQAVELGVGSLEDVDIDDIRVYDEDSECDWDNLVPPRTRPLRQDEIEGFFGAFSVHTDGSVIANNLTIYGGSIDLGSFHIIGKEHSSARGYGAIVQFGHSDFVGPSHFYGNVGIGPNLGTDGQPIYDEYTADRGNLFQTHGYAAFGIIMPNELTNWHQTFTGEDGNMQIRDGIYYGARTEAGKPGILDGSGESIQQSAMLAINTYSQEDIRTTTGRENAYAGHFWPMAFRYANAELSAMEGGDAGEDPTVEGVHAYMTTMDIFKSKTFSISNGAGGPGLPGGGQSIDGGNYFRIGPWGYEFVRGYICYGWQNEDESKPPEVNRKGDNEFGPRGVIGIVNRGGGGGATSPAIGMTSWGNAAIIISSDENFMLKTKNWMSLRANASEDILRNNDATDQTKIEQSGGFLAELSMGSVQSTTYPSPSAILKVHSADTNRTHARAIVQVVDWNAPDGTSLVGMVHSADARAGIQFTPDYTDFGTKPGTYLYARKEDIHIIRFPDGTGTAYCQDSINVTEGLFRQTEIVFYAKDRVTIAWGEGQGAHTDPSNWKHAAIFTGDGIQVINDGSASGGAPAPDPSPGSGGGTNTPPEPAEPGKKKYCIYLGDQDNASGVSEITWQTNFISISSKQVWIGGASSQAAHNPTNFMLFAQNAIDMRGAYATPDNQFHIYARFG